MTASAFKKRLSLLIDKSSSQAVIEQEIFDFFVTKPIPILKVAHPFVARARINSNSEIFSNVSQLSYNPKKTKIKLQRANYPRQQVFYGSVPSVATNSDCQSTALVETCMEHVKDHSQLRVYLTISRWVINRPLVVSILPFSSISCKRNSDFKRANENYTKIIFESIDKRYHSARQYFIDSLEFMSDIFCQTNDKQKCYQISASYYNVVNRFFKNKNIYLDGLIYPSANTEASGMNIALRKETVVDGTINCDFVAMMAMQRDPANPKNISFQSVSDEQHPDKNGNFVFRHVW